MGARHAVSLRFYIVSSISRNQLAAVLRLWYAVAMFALGGRCSSLLTRTWFPPVVAGIVFHLPALFCAFVYDDVSLVSEHPRLGSASFLSEIWQRDYGQEFVGENRGFYRPVFMTLVFLLRNLFGPSPFVFHLFSLAVFCLAIVLVVRVASAFDTRGTRILPLVAGVLYAVHPVRAETVSLVMSLPDLIVECCALGLVLVLANLVRVRPVTDTVGVTPAWRGMAVCGLLALAASLTKESSFFVVPAVVGTAIVFALLSGAWERKRLLPAAVMALAALAIGLLLRNLAQVHTSVPLSGTVKALLLGGRAPDTLRSLLLAARDIVIPGPVVFWRNVEGTHLPGAAVALVLLGAAVAGGWIQSLRRRHLPLALLVAWFGANLASLVILFGSGFIYSHRYLAFAPIAILLCLAVRAADGMVRRRTPAGVPLPATWRLGVLVTAMYVTAHGAFTLAGSTACLTELSFFTAMQRANPHDVVPVGAVAQTLNKGGAAEDVEQCVRYAASLDATHPQVPRLQNMLIQRYLADGRYTDALRCAQWSVGMYSNDVDKVVLRAVALANLGQTNAARQDVEGVLARQPGHAGAKELRDQIVRRAGTGSGQ